MNVEIRKSGNLKSLCENPRDLRITKGPKSFPLS
jgi:hypothetical protein